jgi:hypothetical protein
VPLLEPKHGGTADGKRQMPILELEDDDDDREVEEVRNDRMFEGDLFSREAGRFASEYMAERQDVL